MMFRNHFKVLGIPLLTGLLVLAGCTDQDGADSGRLLAPEGGPSSALLRDPSGRPYRLVNEDPKNDKPASGWGIFRHDQWAQIYVSGGHKLEIPKGAVDKETLWRMTVHKDGLVYAELEAYQRDANGDFTVEVGSKGFKVPVTVILSYNGASGYERGSQLKVLWLKDASTVEVAPSVSLEPGWKISAKLNHFSPYAVGWPE